MWAYVTPSKVLGRLLRHHQQIKKCSKIMFPLEMNPRTILNLLSSLCRPSKIGSCSVSVESSELAPAESSSHLKTTRALSFVDCDMLSSGSNSKSPMITSMMSWLKVSMRVPFGLKVGQSKCLHG